MTDRYRSLRALREGQRNDRVSAGSSKLPKTRPKSAGTIARSSSAAERPTSRNSSIDGKHTGMSVERQDELMSRWDGPKENRPRNKYNPGETRAGETARCCSAREEQLLRRITRSLSPSRRGGSQRDEDTELNSRELNNNAVIERAQPTDASMRSHEPARGHSPAGCLVELSGQKGAVTCCCVAEGDLRGIVTGSQDGTIWLWSISCIVGTYQGSGVLLDAGVPVTCCAVNSSGAVAGGLTDGCVLLSSRGRSLRVRQTRGAVTAVAFMECEELLISTGGDNTVRLWAVGTGEMMGELHRHYGCVRSVCSGLDGTLATAGDDRIVRVWRTHEGRDCKCEAILRGHTGRVLSVSFSPNGKLIVSGGSDNLLRVVKWATAGENAAVIENAHATSVTCVRFSPSGYEPQRVGHPEVAVCVVSGGILRHVAMTMPRGSGVLILENASRNSASTVAATRWGSSQAVGAMEFCWEKPQPLV